MKANESINIEMFRQRNINAINVLIEESKKIEEKYAAEKRQTLIEYDNEKNFKSEEEKNAAINEALAEIELAKKLELEQIKEKLQKTIKIQAKELTRLNSNEEIYKYYKMISENRLSDEYNSLVGMSLSEFESNIYREFLMENKDIENIIISYSTLEEKKNSKSSLDKKTKENMDTDDIEERLNRIREVKYYLEIFEKSKNMNVYNFILDLINELKNEKDKEFLLDRLERIKNKIINGDDSSFDDSINDDEVLAKVKELLEKAENTNRFKDYYVAFMVIRDELKESKEKEEFEERIKNVNNYNCHEFFKLLELLNKKVSSNDLISEDEILILNDKYQFLKKEDAMKNKKAVDSIIAYYNNGFQEQVKKDYSPDNKKYRLIKDKFIEFLGKPVNWISGTKLGSKIINRGLRKSKEKLAKLTSDKKEPSNKLVKKVTDSKLYNKCAQHKIKKQQNKVNVYETAILDQDIASGVNLFIARNYLNKMKPKLYKHEDLINYQAMGIDHSKKAVIRTISKKLDKNMKHDQVKNEIKSNKTRVINILDQYVELLATGEYNYKTKRTSYEQEFQKAHEFLASVQNVLAPDEYYAFYEQFNMIKEYRDATNGEIYEINRRDINGNISYEVDNIQKYYDSDDYEYYRHNSRHILRK